MRIMHVIAQTISDPSLLEIPKGNNITDSNVENGLQIVFAVAGAVALLIIVISGLRYTLSQGDPGAIGKAKNSILYALVGLVISMLGFAIVRFVVRGIS